MATVPSNVSHWVEASQLLGRAVPPGELVALFRGFNRRVTVYKLARLAAIVANCREGPHGTEVRQWSHDLLLAAARRPGAGELERRVAAGLLRFGTPPAILHGQVIYFLYALAFAECPGESGVEPSDAWLAFAALAANDHLATLLERPERFSNLQHVTAALCYHGMFNKNDDPLRAVARTMMLAEVVPPRGPLAQEGAWAALQESAFGCPFAEYAKSFLAPLYVHSRTWGEKNLPVFQKSLWFPFTQVPAALQDRWTRAVTMTEAEAVAEARAALQPSGLPRITARLLRTVFVSFGEELVALSPGAAADYLALGPWAAMRGASTSSNVWTSAFGDIFELECRTLAREAAATGTLADTLLLSDRIGEDEIEDVVFVRERRVILCSVKARTFADRDLKNARSLGDIMRRIEEFFFAQRTENHREGAVRLLDKKVSLIRRGDLVSKGIPSDAEVLPLVISFDTTGESPVLYKLLDKRCHDERLLSYRDGVRPLEIGTLEELESLLAWATHTGSVCNLLATKTAPANRFTTLQAFLLAQTNDGRALQLPSERRRFLEITALFDPWAKAAGVPTTPLE